jgi:hypothetical protein
MIKGDPIEPSRLELYYKQITMKYRENKSNITEYKQKEIQEKKPIACTLSGSSSQWRRERSSTMDRGQRNWRGEDRQKLQKNSKKHRNRQKSNTAKYQTKTRMEEARDEKKGRGAPDLGTSSKLLESDVRGTCGGGVASAHSSL